MVYTIKAGDTLYKLAEQFNTTIDDLVAINGLVRPNDLVVGQNIWIPTKSSQNGTYTVKSGDTMYQISRAFQVSLDSLIAANPQISNPDLIQIGQVINIPNNNPTIEVNGYAIANINDMTLDRTLPYLTYLSIFSYQARNDGSLTGLFEERLISSARDQRVAPIMVVTNIGDNGFDSDIARAIFRSPQAQTTLINNITQTINQKGYSGVNIDFEYLYPEDREAFISFLRNLKSQLQRGQLLTVAVAPKYRDNQSGILYEAHDYRAIGEIADRVIIMTYEWGYLYGEPMAISPLSEVEAVISYAVTRIPAEKILMGLPNYAYDWATPWKQGDTATTFTHSRALEIAIENNANIMFDTKAQSPYFTYTDSSGQSRVVWFEDARSIDAKLNLIGKYNLAGISVWTINNYYPILWSIISARFNIKKLI